MPDSPEGFRNGNADAPGADAKQKRQKRQQSNDQVFQRPKAAAIALKSIHPDYSP